MLGEYDEPSLRCHVGCFSLWNVRVGLSAGTYFKGVQVVLVWKYSESEEEPRPLNITLRTARAYAARDRSWQPVRNSSSHIEPPLIYDNREHYWVPPAPLGAASREDSQLDEDPSSARGRPSCPGALCRGRRMHQQAQSSGSALYVFQLPRYVEYPKADNNKGT